MDNFDISGLLRGLESISEQRRRIRGKLFKFVRNYYPCGKYKNFSLERRMSLNYLSDYSDNGLLEICKEIYNKLPRDLKLECGGESIEHKEPIF